MSELPERPVTVAVIQCPLSGGRDENVARIESHVRTAAARGAQIVLPPELFEGPYFPREEREDLFDLARPAEGNPTIERFSAVAAELGIVVPISFFERAGSEFYNSVVVLDADGTNMGLYRKSHIPDGPGYEEKYYFRPGNTGFRAFATRHGTIGVGICWDQWFPECARAMILLGAELLLYPTAIGSEPYEPSFDTKDAWQRVMMGHAVANAVPVAAANRVGVEGELTFYGSSFIADIWGERVAELGRAEEGVALHHFDLEALRRRRNGWGFFRDRRPDLYRILADTLPTDD